MPGVSAGGGFMNMRRWLLLPLVMVVVAASFFVLRARLTTSTPIVRSHLGRVPNSAYKYHLCTESFAFILATPDNPYKTDYTFRDPFRHVDDTIIPRYLGFDKQGITVSFSVKIIIDQVATYNETIARVRELDGISVFLPDTQNQLQRSSVPQFIVSYLPTDSGSVAVLDYTCPNQWVWSVIHK
jgi:hypothetical protein